MSPSFNWKPSSNWTPTRYSLSEFHHHSNDRYSEQSTNVTIHRSSAISPSSMSIHFREKAIQREVRRGVIHWQSIFSCKHRFFEFLFIKCNIHTHTHIYIFFLNYKNICQQERNNNFISYYCQQYDNESCRFETWAQVVIIESSVTFVVAALK